MPDSEVRVRRKLQGKCPHCGRKYGGKFYTCPICREKYRKIEQRRKQRRAQAERDNAEAFRILESFRGSTLIERARSAKSYFDSVESALV